MGVVGSAAAAPAPASVTSIPNNFIESVEESVRTKGGEHPCASGGPQGAAPITNDAKQKYFVQKRLHVFKSYLEVCSAFNGVATPTFPSDEFFQQECVAHIPIAHRLFQRKGQRQTVANGIFYYVLLGPEVKMFSAHLKALEILTFLQIPSLVVPRTATVRLMGFKVACIAIHPIVAMVRQGKEAPPKTKQLTLVSRMLTAALRLKGEPALALAHAGDGHLLVIDASNLLPPVCAEPTNGKFWHTVRPEILVGRECTWAQASGGSLQTSRSGKPEDMVVMKPWASVMSDLLAEKKKLTSAQTLQACAALLAPSTAVLGETLNVLRAPSPSIQPEGACWEVRHSVGFRDSLPMSHYLYSVLLPHVAVQLDTVREDLLQTSFVSWLHSLGVGMHMLGSLWIMAKRNSHGRCRLAVEMVCRAGKAWLNAQLQSQSHLVESLTIGLFRDICTPDFMTNSLMPVLESIFGDLGGGTIPSSELPFKLVFERLQALTGATIINGRLEGMIPKIRMARQTHALLPSDVVTICNTAAKRDDGVACTIVVHACCWWGKDIPRLQGLVDQLEQWSQQTDPGEIMQLLITMLGLDLVRLRVKLGVGVGSGVGDVVAGALSLPPGNAAEVTQALSVMETIVPRLTRLLSETPSESLLATYWTLWHCEMLMKVQKPAVAAAHIHRLIQQGTFSDPRTFSTVACRNAMEVFHRVAVECLHSSRQNQEAFLIAQKWYKVAPYYFNEISRQMCRAAKLLLVSLNRCKLKKEAHTHALEYMTLCQAVYGDSDSRTGSALNDAASVIWPRNPTLGLQTYNKALETFRRACGPVSKGACSTLYNMGLTYTRLNRFRAAMAAYAQAKEMARLLREDSTTRMCAKSEETLRSVAAMKIQRWYREFSYGQAKSQTTKTDVTTTKCSTLSWSDDHDEIESSTHDL